MELSKAPRLTPFTAWSGSCEGASVLAGGEGAAAGGGGGGGGGGNADIPVEERGQSVFLQVPCTHAMLSPGQKGLGEDCKHFPSEGPRYFVIFLKLPFPPS